MALIINCTPHKITIIDSKSCVFDSKTRSYKSENPVVLRTIAPSGNCPRCKQNEIEQGLLGFVPVISVEYGEIEGLPPEVDGIYLIVSALVANAGKALGRKDLLIPARLVRNESGQIIGCLALAAV